MCVCVCVILHALMGEMEVKKLGAARFQVSTEDRQFTDSAAQLNENKKQERYTVWTLWAIRTRRERKR